MIRRIEACSLAAWPALESRRRHGWVLRCSGGHSRRANAASPLDPADDIDAVRREAERFYARRGRPTLFRLTPLAPPEADAALAEAGYAHEDDCLVMTRGLPGRVEAPEAGVRFATAAQAGWLAGTAAAGMLAPEDIAARDAIVARIRPPACFVTIPSQTADAAPIAYGLAVVEHGWVGLFGLVTAPEARRQGAGGRLVRALLWWGQRSGAGNAYLQVGARNAPALALYTRAGFTEAYGYHYRRRG